MYYLVIILVYFRDPVCGSEFNFLLAMQNFCKTIAKIDYCVVFSLSNNHFRIKFGLYVVFCV
jgi:hypothetical protein